jgi:hypothetical protein
MNFKNDFENKINITQLHLRHLEKTYMNLYYKYSN